MIFRWCICILAWVFLYLDGSVADSASWRHVVSWGGEVLDIAIDPANPDTVYTILWPAKKTVFRSTDGGKNWEPVFNPHESLLDFVKCSRTEPEVVYAGGNTQLFKSTDSGENWKQIYQGTHYTSIQSFVVADATAQRLYLSDRSVPGEVYRSDDGGANWIDLSPGDMSYFFGQNLAVSKIDADTIYFIAPHPSRLVKSEDGGNTWIMLDIDVDRRNVLRIVTHPTQRDTVYLFSAHDVTVSRDRGSTWRVFRLLPGQQFAYRDIWINPLQPDALYAKIEISKTPAESDIFLYQSLDGGETWELAPFNLDPFTGATIHDIQFHPTQAGIIYLSAGSLVVGGLPCQGASGLFKSLDAGRTWRRLPNRSNFGWIQLDAGGRFAYVSDEHQRASQSHNYWRLNLQKNEMKPLLPRTCDEVYTSVAVSPTLPHHLIAHSDPPGDKIETMRSRHAGDSWEIRSEDSPSDGPVSLIIDPRYTNTVYLCTWFFQQVGEAASIGTVYKTNDGGRTWVKLKEGPAPVQAFISSAAPDTVYLLAHDVDFGIGRWSLIYRSDDAGTHWRKMPLPGALESKREWIQEMAVSPHHPGVLYVVTNQFRFFESTVDGEWLEKSQGLPPKSDREGHAYPHISSLVPDPRTSGRLYAAIITGDRKYPHSVYVRPYADALWESYASGLEAVEVNVLSIDPINSMLYGATTAGIYATPLYAPSDFEPDLSAPIVESRLLQNYPNPLSDGTHLPYQLLRAGDVILDIHNGSGHLVHSIELGVQSKGHYLLPDQAAYWDGRNAAGESVADGIYFYTLKVDQQPSDTKQMAVMKK